MLKKSSKMMNEGQIHSPTQEKSWGKRLGGKTTAASGSRTEKGDVRVKGILRLENKCTQNKSFKLTTDMIYKIENAALPSGEVPAIQIDFIDSRGVVAHQVAVVPVYVLDMMVETWRVRDGSIR